MVADIELLQGKVVDDPAERIKGMAQLIEALAIELQKSQADNPVKTEKTDSTTERAP